MTNITDAVISRHLSEGLLSFFRVEEDGLYANLPELPHLLSEGELNDLTFGLGLRKARHTPVLRLPCSVVELNKLLIEMGDRVDSDLYCRLFGLDDLRALDKLPGDQPVPLTQWMQAFSWHTAGRLGYEPWSDEAFDVMAQIIDLVEGYADTFPALIPPRFRPAHIPRDFTNPTLCVRPMDAARWLAERAPELVAEAALAERWKASTAQKKRDLALEAMERCGTQTAAARSLGITRQRLAKVLRNDRATVAPAFPQSAWKPPKR